MQKNRVPVNLPTENFVVAPIKFKHLNYDFQSNYLDVGSTPDDTRNVLIDIKKRELTESAPVDGYNYVSNKGLLSHVIQCELEYLPQRFLNDAHLYSFLVNAHDDIKNNIWINRLFIQNDVPINMFSLIMWNLLYHMKYNGAQDWLTATSIMYAIKDNMPKALTNGDMRKTAFKVAKEVDERKFYLHELPLTTPVIDTVNDHLFMLATMRNECGIYINTTAPNLGNPKTTFIIQFGKHHLALFSLLNKIHYNMWRINGQSYKFKSLKKELSK